MQGSTIGTGEIAGKIVDNGTTTKTSVAKAGSGTWTLSGANTYSGTTTVSAGTLLATNTSGSATGTGAVTVNSGGTIGGTGTIGAAGSSVTIASGGKITGGTDGTVASNIGTIGTLSVASALTINGTYVADLSNTSNSSDLLQLNKTAGTDGVLTLSGATLTLNGTLPVDGNGNGVYSYVLATYSSLMGTFSNFTNPAGYNLVYGTTELDLVPLPEPSTWLGGFFLLGTIVYSQRRRFAGLAALAQTVWSVLRVLHNENGKIV